MTGRAQPDRLARAVRALLLGERARTSRPTARPDVPSRLDAIEREVQEMRTRVNALFFAVLTAGVADLVARAVLR
jgi:hypothetical protein